MAPQLTVTNGPLARGEPAVDLLGDELLAGAGLAGDEHADVGAGDLLDPLVDLDHLRTRADDLAELDVVEPLLQADRVAAQLVDQLGVLDEQRGLGGVDPQGLELLLLEQVHDAVVADVDQPEELAADDERHAHHARELEVDHRHAVLKAGVVIGVADDLRLARGDDLADDLVRQQLLGVVDRLTIEAAGDPDLVAVALGEHQEALARAGQARPPGRSAR